MAKMYKYILVLTLSVMSAVCVAQPRDAEYRVISSDEVVTISYCTDIKEVNDGDHQVWVKADYHASEWQNYFASQVGLRTPVFTTLTKAWYNSYYALCMVRRVLLYSKSGKLLYDTGEDGSAGWGYVNASDPVGRVGEYLGR